MANADSPIGLRPIRMLGGGVYNGSGSLYHVAVGDANVIAPGDPVTITGEADTTGIPTVTRTTAGDTERITGVMIGITNGEGTVLQTSTLNTVTLTSQYILVEDNTQVVYEVQAAGTIAAGDIGATANLLIPAPTSDGKSGAEVGTVAGASTSQVQILRLVRRVDNALGLNANLEVIINLPTTANDTAGV